MGSNYYALAIFKLYTEIAKGTVTIDAQADAIWENVMAVPLQITTGTVAASANVKLLWDEEMLYVYAEVTDPVLNADSADDYQQDSLEVFIDENNHKTEAYANRKSHPADGTFIVTILRRQLSAAGGFSDPGDRFPHICHT